MKILSRGIIILFVTSVLLLCAHGAAGEPDGDRVNPANTTYYSQFKIVNESQFPNSHESPVIFGPFKIPWNGQGQVFLAGSPDGANFVAFDNLCVCQENKEYGIGGCGCHQTRYWVDPPEESCEPHELSLNLVPGSENNTLTLELSDIGAGTEDYFFISDLWIVYTSPQTLPVPDFKYKPAGSDSIQGPYQGIDEPMSGGIIDFDCSPSSSADGYITNYDISFGDGRWDSSNNPIFHHIYDSPGIYDVWMTVTDNFGNMNSTVKKLDLSLQPGDIVIRRTAWSNVPGFWSHCGMWVGDGIIEAYPDGTNRGVHFTPFERYTYPEQTWVSVLRVKTATEAQRQAAVNFVRQEYNKNPPPPYNLHILHKHTTGEDWYCSELIWAAYYVASGGAVNLQVRPNDRAIIPYEIAEDNDVEFIGGHYENKPLTKWLFIFANCPVDLSLTDPENRVANKSILTISEASYGEADFDDDNESEDWIILPDELGGQYHVSVIPESGSSPSDTYSLGIEHINHTTQILAQNEQISDIPSYGYSFVSPAPRIASIYPAKHGHDGKKFKVTIKGSMFETNASNTTISFWRGVPWNAFWATNIAALSPNEITGKLKIPKKIKPGWYNITVQYTSGMSATLMNGFKVKT